MSAAGAGRVRDAGSSSRRRDEHCWSDPPASPTLNATDVHVWKAHVAPFTSRLAHFATLLDVAERARADRFHAERDRTQYVVAHGLLRTILASYLDVAPMSIRFTSAAQGKPRLASNADTAIEFNLSHAGDVILVAVASGGAVGVDVEQWVTDMDYLPVATQFFSHTERAALAGLDGADLCEGFFACWTRKEAYIKATGLGVSAGLDYFDVTLNPVERAALVADRLHPGAPARWGMHNLAVVHGYSGALACAAATTTVARYAVRPDSRIVGGSLPDAR